MNALLSRLCEEMRMPPIALGSDGRVALEGRLKGYTATISIAWHEDDDVLMLLGPIGQLPKGEPGGQLLAALLGLNLAVDQTAGMAFGWDPGSETVLLTHSLVGPAVAYEPFHATFFRLFGAVVAWKDRFEKNPSCRPVSSINQSIVSAPTAAVTSLPEKRIDRWKNSPHPTSTKRGKTRKPRETGSSSLKGNGNGRANTSALSIFFENSTEAVSRAFRTTPSSRAGVLCSTARTFALRATIAKCTRNSWA
ncbi:MAG: type III secretion system chaperone [Polyangiaceae bacterium]|nr:type III secretion system chaperone [Polyangiaceae bacterium]